MTASVVVFYYEDQWPENGDGAGGARHGDVGIHVVMTASVFHNNHAG